MLIKRISGTKDILPEEVVEWQRLEAIARHIFSLYNYQEMRPPLIEEALLFNRSLGQASEIVQKQMFLINRDKEVYTLRPEGTASVVRAYIENNLNKTAGFLKVYYIGAMFRAERPQKGRLRQFHHIGAEAIGSSEANLDVEIIALADELIKAFSLSDYRIKINSLGCPKDKKALAQNLHQELKNKLTKLCADCKRRFKNNPLRILDCKNQRCQEVISGLSLENVHLCPECKAHFAKVKQGLGVLKINYGIAPHLVRGLDYYTRTVFEITHPDLGAQDALGAGGRYDNLVEQLGGPDLGAAGFALGIERILLVSSLQFPVPSKNLVYLISLGEEAKKQSLKLLFHLRNNAIIADTDYENKSLKAAMRKANDLGAKFVLIIGDDELKKNVVTLKDMSSGEQKEIKSEGLLKELKC